jgi:hypothetical protein
VAVKVRVINGATDSVLLTTGNLQYDLSLKEIDVFEFTGIDSMPRFISVVGESSQSLVK